MNKILIFIALFIIGFALAFSFADYSYADNTQTDRILLEMCLQKLQHGIVDNCNNIRHTIKESYVIKKSDVGIILSNSCLTMIKHNITTNCPSYDLLQNTYPNVIIDPDSNIINKIRIITISTALPDYKIPANSTSTTLKDNSFGYSFGNLRYVDNLCNDAIITPSLALLGDTIWHMENNCDQKYTNIDTIKQYKKDATPINHSDYTYYKYKSWLDDTIQNCTKQYGICK